MLVPAAFAFNEPGFIDAYYYFHVAANLASGKGFTEDVIWSYLTDPGSVSHASNAYWMPLVSIAISPFLALFGATFRAAQLPLVVVAALVPGATAAVARSCLGGWFKPLAAAGLVLFSGYYFAYWVAVDGFGLYCLASLGTFLATTAILRDTRALGQAGAPILHALVLGICAALAHLTRADGVLLLVTNLGVIAWVGRKRALLPAAIALGAYLLVMAPWFIRNELTLGAPLGASGLQTAFLQEYNDIFAYGQHFDLGTYLAQDTRDILAGKAAAALRNLGVLFGLEYWLLPFAFLGWRAALRGNGMALSPAGDKPPRYMSGSGVFLPPLVYGVVLYLVMTLVFTFPSGRGSMLHSSVALLPWLAIAAVDGIERSVRWVAQRRAHWEPERALRNFTLIFTAFSVSLSLYTLFDQARSWTRQTDAYRLVAPAVLRDRPDSVAMVLNAPGWWYVTGRPAIQTPSNGPDAALAAARRYGATHLVTEPAYSGAWQPFIDDPGSESRLTLLEERNGYRVYGILRGPQDGVLLDAN